MQGSEKKLTGTDAGEGEAAPAISLGDVLADRYELKEVLGSGGMGRVYLAFDRTLQRDVAAKVLHPTLVDPDALRRFSREALAMGALQHPNVVSVFDAGEHAGRPFFVTELLRGKTLRQRMSEGPLSQREAVSIARQIAEALQAAHEKGFTHRDLKPENVFITSEGRAKLLDFGIVKLASRLDSPPPISAASTEVGRVMGTVGYMAPEQVRGSEVDARADLFAFGAVFHEMLSGKRAFGGETSVEVGYAILFKEPKPLPENTPLPLRRLIRRALEKNVEQRVAKASEIVEALDQYREAKPPRFKLPPKKFWWAALALVVLAGLGFAGVQYKRARARQALMAQLHGTVAILPFSTREAPQFAYLSEGIVDLLERDMDNGPLRVVSAENVLRALGRESASNLDSVRSATMKLSAGYFVFGRIEQMGDKLLFEAVLRAGDSDDVVTQAVAQGSPDEVLKVVRSLSDQLQGARRSPKELAERFADLTHKTTSSPEALRYWLQGEQLRRGAHWDDAIEVLQRATTADTGFALAHYHLGSLALGRSQPGLAEDSLQRALANPTRLSPSQRVLAQAALAVLRGEFGKAENLLLDGAQQFADDPEIWESLGELYFHQNSIRSRVPGEAREAFQHELNLNPVASEAINHLMDLAEVQRDRPLVASMSDRLLPLTDDPLLIIDCRLAGAWARKDLQEMGAAFADAARLPANSLKAVFVRAIWQMDDFEEAQKVAAVFLKPEQPDSVVVYGHYLNGVLQLLEGRPSAAREELLKGQEASPDTPLLLVWLSTLDTFRAPAIGIPKARTLVDSVDTASMPILLPFKLYLKGALAVQSGQETVAEELARELATAPGVEGSSIPGDLVLALRARMRLAKHDPAGAIALLEKQTLRVPSRYAWVYGLFLSESWLRGEAYEAVGRGQDALRAYDAVQFYSVFSPVTVPIAHLHKGLTYEQLGNTTRAVNELKTFLELWKNSEASEKPQLDLARQHLEMLTGSQATKP